MGKSIPHRHMLFLEKKQPKGTTSYTKTVQELEYSGLLVCSQFRKDYSNNTTICNYAFTSKAHNALNFVDRVRGFA